MIVKLLGTAAGLYVAVAVVSGLEYQGDWPTFALLAVILALVNTVVKPIVNLLSLPLVVLTLGLFLLVVNALMLSLVLRISDGMDLGLTSTGFGTTLVGALVVSLVAWGVDRLVGDD